jgi:hypothetical protein
MLTPSPRAARRRAGVIAVLQPRAVVGGKDDERVLVEPVALDRIENLTDRPIDLRNHVAVQPVTALAIKSSDTNSGTCGIE